MRVSGAWLVVAAVGGCWLLGTHRSAQPHQAQACRVTDGDTIRCGSERIRLNGIDAPEMPGHCRLGRQCVEGDPFASADHLRAGLALGPVTVTPLKTDRYGRTVAEVKAGDLDLSCYQWQADAAQYVGKWDEAGTLAAVCR